MEINITYKSPEHEAAFLSELQRIPHSVNPESGRVNPYWGASLYLLSALTRWPELRIAVIGEDYMMFTAAKEAFNLSQNERIVVELAANFYNAGLWEMPGFEMVYATCDTAFTLILEAFRLRRANLFYKDGEVSAEWEERKCASGAPSPSCALALRMTCPPGGQSTGRMRLPPSCWKITRRQRKSSQIG